MRRRNILILLFTMMLIGCSNKVETLSNESISANDNDTVNSDELTTKERQEETSTKDNPVISDRDNGLISTGSNPYHAVRLPSVADYSFMKEQVLSLDKSRSWGDAHDLRQADLTNLDLTNELDHLSNLVFDTATIWPDKLPQDFDPKSIMELGKNPGLGIRALHEKVITGKGINIAIVDYTLLVDHEEYCNQI